MIEDKQHYGCTQFPLCLECHNIVEDSDLPYRICVNCGSIEWDELNECTDDNIPLKHICKSGSWICIGSYCAGENEQQEMFDYALEQAGGLNAVQEEERRRYYVSKYGEY